MTTYVPTSAEIVYKGGKTYTLGRFTFKGEEGQICDDPKMILYCMRNSKFVVTVRTRRPVKTKAVASVPAVESSTRVARKTKKPPSKAPTSKKKAPSRKSAGRR